MGKKDDLKKGTRGGLNGLFNPSSATTKKEEPINTPEKTKRVHCNFVMDGDIHTRMKVKATQKGITLIKALEEACTKYLDAEE